jgi:uncharacterized membrane protein HdeD (DUF308 family)
MKENKLLPEFFRSWKWLIVRGIFSIIFGIGALLYPSSAVTALAIFFGAYVLIDGVFAIVSIFTSRFARDHFWSYLGEGIAGIVIGIVTFFIPELSLYGLVLLVSAWAFVTGIFEIITAIKLREIIDGEFFMITSGVLSIIVAILVFLRPFESLIIMIFLVGMYAVLTGILLVFLGISVKEFNT